MKTTLWTKDFTLVTIGNVVGAIGGTAVSFAMSLVVFDNTSSTWLAGVFAAVMMIPTAVLPVLAAPYVDRCSRKKIMVRLDALLGVIYLLFSVYLARSSFSYALYMVFGLVRGCIGTISMQAYSSLYPELISKGLAQKGYSVASTIYPMVSTLVTPVAAVVYSAWGIAVIFYAEGILLLIAAFFECFITVDRVKQRRARGSYIEDLMGGIRYLKKEKGIRSIYSYMATVSATANGNSLMAVAHFQSSGVLSTAMYSFLISSETLGRMLGGLLHYFIKIPAEKRYRITEKVYVLYESLDGIMLLMAYPVMIVIRFVLGFLGVNSATLRAAAVQKYLPSGVRARVEALFLTLISAGQMIFGLVAGALGEVLPYPVVSVIFGGFGLLCIELFVIRNRTEIEKIYRVDN